MLYLIITTTEINHLCVLKLLSWSSPHITIYIISIPLQDKILSDDETSPNHRVTSLTTMSALRLSSINNGLLPLITGQVNVVDQAW